MINCLLFMLQVASTASWQSSEIQFDKVVPGHKITLRYSHPGSWQPSSARSSYEVFLHAPEGDVFGVLIIKNDRSFSEMMQSFDSTKRHHPERWTEISGIHAKGLFVDLSAFGHARHNTFIETYLYKDARTILESKILASESYQLTLTYCSKNILTKRQVDTIRQIVSSFECTQG